MKSLVIASATAIALATTAAQAADPSPAVAGSGPPAVYLDAPVPSITPYFLNWFNRVDQAQASQPHWMTPLVTVTPRLEEEVRYDQYWEHQHTGANLDLYDMGKGLELIPTTTNEILLNPPVYEQRSNKNPASGWGDDQFLVVKQRLLSENEQNGNYIVSAFLGVQAPTGDRIFTNHAWLVTPTLAAGKGWGDFDIQGTVGIALPTDHESTIGKAVATNLTLQYHVLKYFWPEFEVNYTHWFGGLRDGKDQVFLTPGLILGRFQLYERARLIIGGGYQFAVSPKVVTTPALTPTYDHAWILTARLAF
jgi:Putative MetA-pathway of phenol degradation